MNRIAKVHIKLFMVHFTNPRALSPVVWSGVSYQAHYDIDGRWLSIQACPEVVSIHGMCNHPHDGVTERLTCEILDSYKLLLSVVIRGRRAITRDFWYGHGHIYTHMRTLESTVYRKDQQQSDTSSVCCVMNRELLPVQWSLVGQLLDRVLWLSASSKVQH